MSVDDKLDTDVDLLHESVLHWNDVASWDGTGSIPSIFADACPLCRVYYDSPNNRCDGCPIRESTGRDHCYSTPWTVAYESRTRLAAAARSGDALEYLAARREFAIAAIAVATYLDGLRLGLLTRKKVVYRDDRSSYDASVDTANGVYHDDGDAEAGGGGRDGPGDPAGEAETTRGDGPDVGG
jgi:hypothetical protein